jgi:hypothetical protein
LPSIKAEVVTSKPGEKLGKFTEVKDSNFKKQKEVEEGEIDENKGKEYISLAPIQSQNPF